MGDLKNPFFLLINKDGNKVKKGNQFYLEVQITDENNDLLDISSVKKVQFKPPS